MWLFCTSIRRRRSVLNRVRLDPLDPLAIRPALCHGAGTITQSLASGRGWVRDWPGRCPFWTTRMNKQEIARICHEINRRFCQLTGDDSQPSWEDAPTWQRSSAISGVEFTIANPDAPPSASHDSWWALKKLEGWVYGETKDPKAKTHPCCVPYEQLPPVQRTKDHLFQAVVRGMSEVAGD